MLNINNMISEVQYKWIELQSGWNGVIVQIKKQALTSDKNDPGKHSCIIFSTIYNLYMVKEAWRAENSLAG